MLDVETHEDVERFLADAGALLLADEARHNLALGLSAILRDSPEIYPSRRFWVVRDGSQVVGAALRTGPQNLVLARPRDDEALISLADAIDDDLSGVVGATPEVLAFAGRWSERRARTASPARGQGIYALERVRPVPAPPGCSRLAELEDRELLLDWWLAFAEEALPNEPRAVDRARRGIEHRLESPDAGAVLWEDAGEMVSLAGWAGPTPNGIRIGPVYTPPKRRGAGYATALVADLSQRLLDGGRQFCFLYTDLANPTANAIYRRIGYELVCESAEVQFDPGM